MHYSTHQKHQREVKHSSMVAAAYFCCRHTIKQATKHTTAAAAAADGDGYEAGGVDGAGSAGSDGCDGVLLVVFPELCLANLFQG